MKYIGKNNAIHHFINLLTFQWVLFSSTADRTAKLGVDNELRPLWVTGLFRSGTTITTRILSQLGFDLGPENHLLKDLGPRANWNPGGFCENHLFMDWSLSVFEALDAWGHIPPSEEDVRNFDATRLGYKQYVRQCIVEVHDDRISNWNKANLLKKYHPQTADVYLRERFKSRLAVKNPHFSVLSELLLKHWPKSRFLVVFRNPDANLGSAKKVAQTSDYDLYINYYSRLLNKPGVDVLYFSYDELIRSPQDSIKALAAAYGLDAPADEVAQLVDPKLNRYQTEMKQDQWPEALLSLYQQMQTKAVNLS